MIQAVDDATIYAVADGHGSADTGHLVSDYCAHHLSSVLCAHGASRNDDDDAMSPTPHVEQRVVAALKQLDNQSIRVTTAKRLYAGSTLCAVLRFDAHLIVANVGDSRAILLTAPSPPPLSSPSSHHQDTQGHGSRKCTVTQLSRDHVCTDARERARIEGAGGIVVGNLLNGYISMSRALGDDDLKAHRNITDYPIAPSRTLDAAVFTGDAEVTRHAICPRDLVVVVASDGVWNAMDNHDVRRVVCKALAAGADARRAAEMVVRRALAKRSRDNVTVVVGLLRDIDEVRAALRDDKHTPTSPVTPVTPITPTGAAAGVAASRGAPTGATQRMAFRGRIRRERARVTSPATSTDVSASADAVMGRDEDDDVDRGDASLGPVGMLARSKHGKSDNAHVAKDKPSGGGARRVWKKRILSSLRRN